MGGRNALFACLPFRVRWLRLVREGTGSIASQPLNELIRCRCRVSQERPDGIRKVVSIFLQIPEQHGQIIPQIVWAKLELECCGLIHNVSRSGQEKKLRTTQKSANFDHGCNTPRQQSWENWIVCLIQQERMIQIILIQNPCNKSTPVGD